MKKTNKAIITTAAVAVAATTIAPLGNVFAATAPTWNGSSSATINRRIQNAYGTINNTFTYTITANSNNPAGATGAPTTASVVFADNYTSQATVTKSATLDFSGMQFNVVGDYSYSITETASTNASMTGRAPAAIPQVAMPMTTRVVSPLSSVRTLILESVALRMASSSANDFMT